MKQRGLRRIPETAGTQNGLDTRSLTGMLTKMQCLRFRFFGNGGIFMRRKREPDTIRALIRAGIGLSVLAVLYYATILGLPI